jgi:hypothetical protein
MNIRSFSILALVLVGMQIPCAAQDPPAQNPPAQTPDTDRSAPAPALSGLAGMDTPASEEDASSDLPQIPALLGGRGSSLAFPSESERSNYLRGGVNVGAAYDDNALLSTSNGAGNTSYSVFPNVAIEQTLPRLRWSLGYAGGLTVNQRLSNNNQGSHDLNFESQFRLSPHVNLRIAEDFSLTSGVFDGGTGAGVQPGAGGPNIGLITPLVSKRSSVTVVETNYHFALKDVVGASGSFYDLHYADPKGTQTLVDARTESGSAFWLHRFFRQDWAGLSYGFERFTFDPDGETRVHSFMVVDTLSFAGKFTISGFIGPQYSDNHGVVAAGAGAGQVSQFSDWSMAGGVDAGWQSKRTSLAVGYSKRVNDGGGILGAVRLQNVHANFRRELFPGWAAAFGVGYGGNKSLTVPFAGAAPLIDTTSVSASLERNIGKSLGLRMGYSRDFQNQSGSSDSTQNFDAQRNRFFVTLSYQWTKPLGR